MQFAFRSTPCRLSSLGQFRLCAAAITVLFVAATGSAVASPAKKPGKGAPAKEPAAEVEAPDPGPSTPPPGSSPMAELKKSNAALKKLFQKQPPSWSPENDAKRSEMRKIVSSFLDFGELARRALGKHWDEINHSQRAEFVSVLRDLIERNYLKQVHGQPNYDLRFDTETVSGSEATVNATLDATSNSKKVKVEMQYKLLYKGTHWLVYDVITDEQSMLENYRAEFNRIITKESFDALLKRMKKRLEKAD
jgi:phospholipid transport system substrate-binding protein